MGAIVDNITRYYKYKDIEWLQPLLIGNDVDKSFKVSRSLEGGGGYQNYDVWGAFSGDINKWSGLFREERWCALNFYMETSIPIRVTGYSFYEHDGWGSEWGAAKRTQFYCSDDGIEWTELFNGNGPGNGTGEYTFKNDKRYNHYRLRIESGGGGHTDYLKIANVKLFATKTVIVDGTEEDHDFTEQGKSYKTL